MYSFLYFEVQNGLMFDHILSRINKLSDYLSSRASLGVDSFQRFAQALQDEQAQWGLLTFAYEDIEAIGMVEKTLKPFPSFQAVLSQSTIDELTDLNCNHDNKLEDAQWASLQQIKTEFIEFWIIHVYNSAFPNSNPTIPLYYKSNFDSSEILTLTEQHHQKVFEESSLEMEH